MYFSSLNVLFTVVTVGYCSLGDRSSDFRSCTSRCNTVACERSDAHNRLSISLRLTGWSCLEDCQYHCMHEVTDQDVKLQRPVRQFFGKVSWARMPHPQWQCSHS